VRGHALCVSVPRPPEEDTGVISAEDTAELRAVEPGPAPLPPGPPPRLRAENPWPWLLLVLVAVAALLVWLFLFHGRSNRHTVPRVVGLSQQAAFAALNRAGFDAKAVRQPSGRPRGVVFAQAPGAGTRLKKGQTVTVDVASGARPPAASRAKAPAKTKTTTVARARVAVPDVTGKPLADAGAAVAAAGLVADSRPVSGGGAAGTVTAQSPHVVLSVAAGGTGATVPVPDVTARTAAEALARLWAARLTARTLYRSGKVGVVLEQQPGPGQAPAYTQVTLYVGR
jgi:beta-lactam-binding protein with PASTA domain